MPITSPVERISGPRMVSTPGKRANGNTASFTATWSSFCGLRPKAGERLSAHDTAAMPGDRQADDLGHERHGARGARIDLEDVDVAALDGELHVHQPDHVERKRELPRLPFELAR